MAKIIYLGAGDSRSTATHRANALSRLGHDVHLFSPIDAIRPYLKFSIFNYIHYRTGYSLLQRIIFKWLKNIIKNADKPDFVWVNSGELLGADCLKLLKTLDCPIILYNNDDPTGHRDGARFDSLLKAIPYYDLCVVRRDVNINEYKAIGAKKVLRVFMSYDEIDHEPFHNLSDIPDKFRSEVAFIGTWIRFEKRDEFILSLIKRGIPVSIWGNRWPKSPYFNELKDYWRGSAIYHRDYVAGIQGAKICLGFLSKGNRDLHTRRSVEVPFIGGLLCAERTSEHLEMYEEGEEAVFWYDADECAELCKRLLADSEKREEIRLAGMRKVRALHLGNEEICRMILDTFQ